MFSFVSIFQLLAAFNFALVGSNQFLISLNTRLTGHLRGCKKKLEIAKYKLNEASVYIEEKIEFRELKSAEQPSILELIKDTETDILSCNDPAQLAIIKFNAISNYTKHLTNHSEIIAESKSDEVLDALLTSRGELKGDFRNQYHSLKDAVDEKIKKESASSNFLHYCLYSGIISIAMLIFPAFDTLQIISLSSKHIDFINEIFLLGLALSWICMISMCSPWEKYNIPWLKQCKLSNIIINLFVSFFVAWIVFVCVDYVFNWTIEVNCTNWIIILALLVTTSHFNYYIFRSLSRNFSKEVKLESEISDFNKSIEDWKVLITKVAAIGFPPEED